MKIKIKEKKPRGFKEERRKNKRNKAEEGAGFLFRFFVFRLFASNLGESVWFVCSRVCVCFCDVICV